jgi:alkanesulfonate monooxygenase SsuD/methylene tetrahydromethanopterin reductase-like flavin-dependent oxidoreductase (luciferase family)
VEIIRSPFAGENVNHHGAHFDVENARLWELPDAPRRSVSPSRITVHANSPVTLPT